MLEPTKSGQHTHPEWLVEKIIGFRKSNWRHGSGRCRAEGRGGALAGPPTHPLGHAVGGTHQAGGKTWGVLGKISKVSRILGGEVLAWFVFFGFQHVDIELKCRNGIKWAYFPFRFIYLNFYRPLNNRLVWDDLGL